MKQGELRVERKILLLPVLVLALCPVLNAQDPLQNLPRFEITPFAGYRTSMSFPIEPHVSGTSPSVVLDASPSFGASFGVRLNGDGLVEMRWTRQDSYARSENAELQFATQRVLLNEFHGDFSREYIVDEWRSWARPFVLLGVGAAHLSSSTSSSFTRFTFGIGAGVRFYPTRHLGFKIQAEWVPVVVSPQVAFVCGGGCVVHVGGSVSSQGEVFAGPTVRF